MSACVKVIYKVPFVRHVLAGKGAIVRDELPLGRHQLEVTGGANQPVLRWLSIIFRLLKARVVTRYGSCCFQLEPYVGHTCIDTPLQVSASKDNTHFPVERVKGWENRVE